MLGWLVVNGFIQSQKFQEIYSFLKAAARKVDIELQMKSNCELLCALDDDFSKFALPQFVLFWDKDVYLAKRLERLGIRVFNSANAVEICDNKILTALALNGVVKTPRTVIAPKTFETLGYCKDEFLDSAMGILGAPVVIKEAYGSFGQQVYLANNNEEARSIARSLGGKEFLMQEFISESRGKDVRVNVVGGKVVCAMLRHNERDFRSNITGGGSMQAYTPDQAMQEIALKACRVIGLDFAGVDILFSKDGWLVCEVNSNPHFKSSLDCTGIDMSVCIMEYICEQIR